MKRILLFLTLTATAFAQVNVQKRSGTNTLTGNIVAGNNTTISTEGTGTLSGNITTSNITVSGNVTASGVVAPTSGNLTLAPGSVLSNRILFGTGGAYAWMGPHVAGDGLIQSFPSSGTSGALALLNNTTGNFLAFGEYRYGHFIYGKNSSDSGNGQIEFYVYNGTIGRAVATLVSSPLGYGELQIRNVTDTNSMQFRFSDGVGATPQITTQIDGTGINISPQGVLTLVPKGNLTLDSTTGSIVASKDVYNAGTVRIASGQSVAMPDSAGTYRGIIQGATDNTVTVGWLSATPTNGHLLFNAGGSERARISPTGTSSSPSSGSLSVGSNVGFSGTLGGENYFGGDIIITRSTNSATMRLNANSGQSKLLQFETAGTRRWGWRATSDAESTGNAGSNMALGAYADNGTFLGDYLAVERSSGNFTVGSGRLIVTQANTPASASATGTTGTISWDSNYIYICVGTNTWKRVAISTW